MNFLERAFDKYNSIWYYILIILLSFILSQAIGAIPIIIVFFGTILKGGSPLENVGSLTPFGSVDNNIVLPLVIFTFIVLLGFAVLFIKIFQKRSFSETVNGTSKIRWSRVFWGYLIWGILTLVAMFVEILLNPEDFTFQFKVEKFIPLFFISVLLIPFQTTSEEFIFRGYMAQGVGSKTKSRILAVLIPSLLFGLLHSFNPEVQEYGFWATMPQYIMFGLAFGLISILDDGIELAMGMHAVNNTLACLLVTSKASALQTDALYVVDTSSVSPLKETFTLLLFSVLAIVFFARKYKWDFNILFKKVEDTKNLVDADS